MSFPKQSARSAMSWAYRFVQLCCNAQHNEVAPHFLVHEPLFQESLPRHSSNSVVSITCPYRGFVLRGVILRGVTSLALAAAVQQRIATGHAA